MHGGWTEAFPGTLYPAISPQKPRQHFLRVDHAQVPANYYAELFV
jgi:hypothetical protein